MPIRSAALAVGLLLTASSAMAHHGLDYLLLQDTSIPAQFSGSVFDNSEWSREGTSDEYATEPGLYFGLLSGLGLGVSSHISDMGDGWKYAATTPYAVINLLPDDLIPGVRMALWVGYEFATEETSHPSKSSSSSARKSSQSAAKTKTVKTAAAGTAAQKKVNVVTQAPAPAVASAAAPKPQHDTGGDTPCGPDAGPDAPPCPDHVHAAAPAAADNTEEGEAAPVVAAAPVPVAAPHVHEGIHRHGESGLHARLIIEADLSHHDKFIFNLINFTPAEGTPAWGYGAGFRHAITHDLAVSLEAQGDFDATLEHQVVLATHFSPYHWLTVKLGVGLGISDEASDVSIHTGLVYRF